MHDQEHKILEPAFRESWVSTRPAMFDNELLLKNEFTWFTMRKIVLDELVPGFTRALVLFTRVGCDPYFVTSVLKYALDKSGDENLVSFIDRTDLLTSVKVALSVGLSGAELIESLSSRGDAAVSEELPSNLF